ncbi:unnamed protein product [marine sediment metagenome]|uniref:Uncharacterized protein n=1 Tax=marine sediment metagenome TaxID=412755 RepID=X1C7F5_9ZZZZ
MRNHLRYVNITDWFDITNIEHLKAWMHLEDVGVWPIDFIPDEVEFNSYWQIVISSKMSCQYVKEKIEEDRITNGYINELNSLKEKIEMIFEGD